MRGSSSAGASMLCKYKRCSKKTPEAEAMDTRKLKKAAESVKKKKEALKGKDDDKTPSPRPILKNVSLF